MPYQPSFPRSVAIAGVLLILFGSGLWLLALVRDASLGTPAAIPHAAKSTPPTTQGLADRSGVVSGARTGIASTFGAVTDDTHGTYELPPSQPHEFTLTTDGQ